MDGSGTDPDDIATALTHSWSITDVPADPALSDRTVRSDTSATASKHRRRIVSLVAAITVVVVAGGGTFVYAQVHMGMTISFGPTLPI